MRYPRCRCGHERAQHDPVWGCLADGCLCLETPAALDCEEAA